MKAYIIHNQSNSTIVLRSKLFPKEKIELKRDAHHMFKSEQEFMMFRHTVDIFRSSGLLKLEVEGDIKKSAAISKPAAPVKKQEVKAEESKEEVKEESSESEESLKAKLSELQSEYKDKKTSKERKSEIKKEVTELKKAINALRN